MTSFYQCLLTGTSTLIHSYLTCPGVFFHRDRVSRSETDFYFSAVHPLLRKEALDNIQIHILFIVIIMLKGMTVGAVKTFPMHCK